MELHVDVREHGVAVVRPVGRLDLLSAPEVKRRLAQEVAAGRPRLVVDLDGTAFMDSSGLGALIGGLKAARLAGGDLRLARPSEQVQVVLRLVKLDRVFRPYATVEQALEGFG
jgi:anti-sigma B factor antagonist